MFRAHPAAVLQHGGGQDAARHLRHLIPHTELELLHEWVSLVVCAAHLREGKKSGTKRQKKRLVIFINFVLKIPPYFPSIFNADFNLTTNSYPTL